MRLLPIWLEILRICIFCSGVLVQKVAPVVSSEKCGEVFLQESFVGPSLSLRDGDQISDLSDIEHYYKGSFRRESTDNDSTAAGSTEESSPKISFQIGAQCVLKMSTDKYLRGEVHEFSSAMQNSLLIPKSVACECQKTCNCEDYKLRRSECARAYLGESCTNCNSRFTSLAVGSPKRFPQRWASGVTNIVLKDGCELELLLTNPAGKRGTLKYSSRNSLVQNVSNLGRIEQYRCTCSERRRSRQSTNQPTRANNYPTSIEIPSSKGSINRLLSKPEFKDHPGLMGALQSLQSKRSPKNAYILLLGLTGSGKSSAINLLFDHPNITKTGDFTSTTSDILEFSIPVPVPTLGMNNTELHVIDTPGIADTRGIEQDARFLATLDDYLSNHEDLRRSLPNIVLIFAKFSDNRYHGEGSSFVKMLRTIDFFKDKIIDKHSTNVVFVLTHAMSVEQTVIRNPSQRIENFRKVIEEFSTLPRPIHIVLAENKPDLHDLLSINGYYQLPFGEFYPKNLFDKMQRNLQFGGDPVGDAVIRTGFANSDDFQISSKTIPLLQQSNSKVIRFLAVLASYNSPVAATPVSQMLEQAYQQMSDDLKTQYPDILHPLQRTLNRKNIMNPVDLPQTSGAILRLMEDVQLNPATAFLLQQAFNFTLPQYTGNYIVGQGYFLTQDKTLHKAVIEFGELQATDVLLLMPVAFSIELKSEPQNCFKPFTTKEDYVRGRLLGLGLPSDALSPTAYSATFTDHPCFNLISFDDEPTSVSWQSLSATVSYYTFQASLKKNATLSAEFVAALGELQPLNLKNDTNVADWTAFFAKYGTHVVTQARGGGSIEIKTEVDSSVTSSQMSNGEKIAVLSGALGNITQKLANELIGKVSSFTLEPKVKYELYLRGGNQQNQGQINITEWDVDLWKESLKYEPVLLPSSARLTPISEVVRELGGGEAEVSFMIEEAASALLNATLLYIPMERRERSDENPEGRGGTTATLSSEGRGVGGDYEVMREFAEIFKSMSSQMQKMREDMVSVLEESQQRQDAEEERYNQEVAQAQREHEEQMQVLLQHAKDERQYQLEAKALEEARLTQENVVRAQMEERRLLVEVEQANAYKLMQQQRQKQMLQMISADNERQARIQMSRRSTTDKIFGYITGGLSTLFNGIGSFAGGQGFLNPGAGLPFAGPNADPQAFVEGGHHPKYTGAKYQNNGDQMTEY